MTLSIDISAELKERAEDYYKSFGISLSDAVTMLLADSIINNKTPYNVETIAAIKEGRKIAKDKKAKTYRDMDSLWGALQA